MSWSGFAPSMLYTYPVTLFPGSKIRSELYTQLLHSYYSDPVQLFVTIKGIDVDHELRVFIPPNYS